MATTTPNFGWSVPTSSDLVKNGATAIETLGDAIDASLIDLKGGTTNQVLAKNSNTDMDFKWVADAAGMTNPMTTTGDTIYSSSGSTPARLGIGSTGQVLTVAGGVPTWATVASGGKVRQVVRATDVTARSTTSTSFVDANISVTITPTANTSNILLIWTFRPYIDTANKNFQFRISDNSNVAISGAEEIDLFAAASAIAVSQTAIAWASPATTSATTYKGRMKVSSGSTGYLGNDNQTGQLFAVEIGA